MRTVFSATEVARLWANQSQESARVQSNNFYFEGNTIFSYGRHFPIAKHVTNKAGEYAILFTEREYSNTTSRHKLHVRRSINYRSTIQCENVEGLQHDSNLATWHNEAKYVIEKFAVARKPEIYREQLRWISDKVKAYTTFFAIPIPERLQAILSIKDKEQVKAWQVTQRLTDEA